ncbi:MAG: transcription antitermination factor NusB [Candidatus Baltobacteraceae bacterium]
MTAREVALRVVRDVFPPPGGTAVERGAQASLDYRVREARLSERDRAFAAELAYGAIKMRRALDWYLDPFIGGRQGDSTPLGSTGAIRELLRLAAYELIYTRAEAYATVSEFVNLAKRYGHRGLANLTNAVLRGFLRDRTGDPQRELFDDEDEYLGTRYSLPTWLVRQWRLVFDGKVEAICAGVNDPAQGAIVVNALKMSPPEAIEALRSAGIEASPSDFVAEALLVPRGSARPPAGGAWWVQSESSAMVVDVLGPQPGEAVLDVGSGRGNKALQIGARLAGEGMLLCIERDARKAATLGRRLEEAGVAAGIVIGDATHEVLRADQRFDRILIDAPCSGLGVAGRHPEARWKKQAADGERLALTQQALLEQMARHVYPGGALVYAVCSTDPRETTEVVDWFLARHDFDRGLIPAAYGSLLTGAGDVLVPPGIGGRDGFYIARVERRS